MDIREFMSRYPIVPPILRGQGTRHFNFHTTEAEGEIISYLAYHPALKDMYKGQIQSVWRQLLYMYGRDLREAMEDGFTTVINDLDTLLLSANLDVTTTEAERRVDEVGKALLVLVEHELWTEAVALYEKTIEFVWTRAHPWNLVIGGLVGKHPAIKKFRELAMLHDYQLLQEVDNKYPS